ncbi:hypothetical protein JNK13_08535 [bacterium]|nr:hypothetical protein [bacterium]
MLPAGKILGSFLGILLISLFLKFCVDRCVDNPGATRWFARQQGESTAYCRQIRHWNNWALRVEAQSQGRVNFYNSQSSAAMQNADGMPTLLLFTKDIQTLPLFLSNVPGQGGRGLAKLLVVAFLGGLTIGFILDLFGSVYSLITTGKAPTKRYERVRRAAEIDILPEHKDQKE